MTQWHSGRWMLIVRIVIIIPFPKILNTSPETIVGDEIIYLEPFIGPKCVISSPKSCSMRRCFTLGRWIMGEPSPEFDLNLFWKIMVRGRNVLICTDSRSNWGERPWFWGRWRAWLVIFKKVEATKQVGQQHIDPCPYPTWDWHVRITYVWDDFMRCTPWSSKTCLQNHTYLKHLEPKTFNSSWNRKKQLQKLLVTFWKLLCFHIFPPFSRIFPHFFPHFPGEMWGSGIFSTAGAQSRWSGWTTWSFGCGPRSTWRCRRSSMTRCGAVWSGWGGWYPLVN
jgi:hypothetical protein